MFNSTPIQRRHAFDEIIHPRLAILDESAAQTRKADLSGRVAEYALVAIVVLIIAGMEIVRWAFNAPPQPLLFGLAAFGIVGYAAVRVIFIVPQLLNLRKEQDARSSLRVAIDDICSRGYLLFDGLTDNKGFLLGSVLVGPGGVFTIIPRFVPRGRQLNEHVEVSGNSVEISGHSVFADPAGQARQAAASLYSAFARENLDTVSIQPVVVFPGWSVRHRGDDPDVFFVNERELVERITHAPAVLEPKDLIGVSLFLERLRRQAG